MIPRTTDRAAAIRRLNDGSDSALLALRTLGVRPEELSVPIRSRESTPLADDARHRTIEDLRHVVTVPVGEGVSERGLKGRWSNGDPVHIITDGVERWIAPNRNGAHWIPEPCGIRWEDKHQHRCEETGDHFEHICWACGCTRINDQWVTAPEGEHPEEHP